MNREAGAGQYDTAPPAPAHLESALALLRTDHPGYWEVTLDRYEAAALLHALLERGIS